MSETAGLPVSNTTSIESAAATAAALAAKLNEQLQKKTAGSTSNGTEQPGQQLPTSVEDALARAREVAARLAPGAKRGREDEAGANAFPWSKGEKHEVRRRIAIPQGHPDIDLQRVLIGPRGSNQKRMENESGARIYIRGRGSGYKESGHNDHDDDDDEPHVLIISDSHEAVDRAESLVREIIDNPEHAMEVKKQQLLILNEDKSNSQGMLPPHNPYMNQQSMMEGHVTDSFTVSYTLAGSIIGRGGEMVMSLSNRSGAKVQVLKAGEMNTSQGERMVIITGAQAAVKEARRLIDELITARGGGDRRKPLAAGLPVAPVPGNISIPLPVPEDKVGAIIGKQGQTIHHIQSSTGCHIEIPKERAPLDENGNIPSGATRLLTISGPTPEAVEAARRAVMQCVNPEAVFVGAKSISVPIEDSKAGLIIGRGGSTIKELQARTGTKVQVSQAPGPDGMRTVDVTGPPAGCEQAREMILNIVAGKLVLPPKDAGRGGGAGQMGGVPMAANPVMPGMAMPYAAGWDMSMHGYNPYAYSMQMPMYGGATTPYGMGATQGHDAASSYYANSVVSAATSGVGAHTAQSQYSNSPVTTTASNTATTAATDAATTMEDFILQLAKQHGVDYAKSAIEHYRTMGYQIGEVHFSSLASSTTANPSGTDSNANTNSGKDASTEGINQIQSE